MSLRALAPLSLLLLSSIACGDEPAQAPAAAPEPIVRPVDLAVTKRNATRPNARAAIVEISPTAIALEGRKLVDLVGGKVPPAALHEGAVNELFLSSTGLASRGVVIRMHALTRYDVMLAVLRALKDVPNVGFAVRAGMTPEMGLLTFESRTVREPSDAPVDFEPPFGHQWSELVALWDEIHSRCEGEHSYQCATKPDRIAEGGKLEIALFTQQDAFVLDFRRYGTDEEPPKPVEWMPPQRTREDLEVEEMQRLPPATQASFFFLRSATQAAESPMALALRPLCQAQACGVRVSAPPATAAGQVLILIGAALPDGFAAPRVVFETGAR